MKKYIGNQLVEMTAEEITEHNTLQKQAQDKNKIDDNALAQQELNKKNSFTKFVNLGLTENEATTITGYKPPEEE
jgi:hypothetical protein